MEEDELGMDQLEQFEQRSLHPAQRLGLAIIISLSISLLAVAIISSIS